jgi:hypothetical protein
MDALGIAEWCVVVGPCPPNYLLIRSHKYEYSSWKESSPEWIGRDLVHGTHPLCPPMEDCTLKLSHSEDDSRGTFMKEGGVAIEFSKLETHISKVRASILGPPYGGENTN